MVRDSFEAAIRNDLVLADAVKITDKFQSQILQRIKIHLVRMFADQDPVLAVGDDVGSSVSRTIRF